MTPVTPQGLVDLTTRFDPWKTFVRFPPDARDLLQRLPVDPAAYRYQSQGSVACSVGHFQKHAPIELTSQIGRMIRSQALEVIPPEWEPHAAAALLGEPLPPPPPSPLHEMMRKALDHAGSTRQEVKVVRPERMSTPLYDELARAAKEVEEQFPCIWTEAVEGELRRRLDRFRGDEIVNWGDERNKQLYPMPRVTRDELRRRHSSILAAIEDLRKSARGVSILPAPEVDASARPRPVEQSPAPPARVSITASPEAAAPPPTPEAERPKQPEEITLSEASANYDIPRATLSKHAKKQPGEVGYVPSRTLGRNRLFLRADILKLHRSIQRRVRPDTRKPLLKPPDDRD